MLINYYQNIEQLDFDLDRSETIIIDNKKYKELINVSYEIPYECITVLGEEIKPNTEDDKKEREYLLKRMDECLEILKKDINSRRAVYCNLYENNLGKCICLVQLFVRNEKVYLNEYFRSQEFKKNGLYDFQTAVLLLDKASKVLNIDPGIITVICFSLHKLEEQN